MKKETKDALWVLLVVLILFGLTFWFYTYQKNKVERDPNRYKHEPVQILDFNRRTRN